MKKLLAKTLMMALLVAPLGAMSIAEAAVVPYWDTTGNYVVAFEYLGSDYAHDMTLSQDNLGNLTGSGGNPAGGTHVYTWALTSGSVSGSVVDFSANYTATADAVTPLTVMHVTGTIGIGGAMSGTWSDNYQGGSRSGTWMTTSGVPVLLGSMATEDFGVVNYDTGIGMLKGYSAGFGLTDATFAGVQSVVVQLYSGATLLQTNTATAKLGVDVTGTQISSPFDVSGTFDYATDGYWTNVRASEFGQSVAATRVVATVTLANGKIVTAENTLLAGDPTTIFVPVLVPVLTDKDQCKKDGWKVFVDPSFKNQGQCISFVEASSHARKHQGDDAIGNHGRENDKGHQETKSSVKHNEKAENGVQGKNR